MPTISLTEPTAIEMGIDAISKATLSEMHHLKDLGIHPEMFAAGILDLIEKCIINGSKKRVGLGEIVSGFVMG